MYEIEPLKVAESVEPEPRIFYLGDCAKTVRLFTYFWLIRGEGENILVDTGFNLADGIRFNPQVKQKEKETPRACLAKFGLAPGNIDTLILTHVHWDHLSPCLDEYSKAIIYVQKKELDYVLQPSHPWFARFVHKEVVEKLAGEYRLRVRLITGEEEVLPGIKVLWTGGHTPGHQSISVETSEGEAVITGDVVFTYRNLEEDIPCGFNSNLEECFQAMARIRKEGEIYYPNHDPLVWERKGKQTG